MSMDFLQELFAPLSELNDIGITEIAIEDRKGNTLIRGKDSSGSVMVCSLLPAKLPFTTGIGLRNLDAFLNRLSLFLDDWSGTEVELQKKHDEYHKLILSHGAREASVDLVPLREISPKAVGDEEVIFEQHRGGKEDKLVVALKKLKPKYISFASFGGSQYLALENGKDSLYEEALPYAGVTDYQYTFPARLFRKIMKVATTDYKNEVPIWITQSGLLKIPLKFSTAILLREEQ